MTVELPMKTLVEQVHPGHTALLIVDVQNDFVHPDGRMMAAGTGENPFFPGSGRLWEAYPLIPRAIENLRSLLAAARAARALIVFVRAIYDPAYIAAPQRAMTRHGLFGVQCQTDTFGADSFEDVRPKAGAREVVVSRPSTPPSGRRSRRSPRRSAVPRRRCAAGCGRGSGMRATVPA